MIIKYFFVCNLISFLTITSVVTSNIMGESDKNEKSRQNTYNFRFGDKEAVRPHYALDPRKAKQLALMEPHLVDTLREIKHGNKYILEFEEDKKATEGLHATQVAENPILTFKMVRRFVVTLFDKLCKEDETVNKIVQETFETVDMSPPTHLDLHDALIGILRIQYIYGFNATSQLRKGILNGFHTNSHLNFHDCLALAKKALELEGDAIAYQWLISATLSSQEHLGKEDLLDLKITWKKLMKLTDLKTMDQLHQNLRNKQQLKLNTFHDFRKYALCRDEALPPLFQLGSSNLYCFNQRDWDPYFYINPVKTEVLFGPNPFVLQFYDFVGDNVINRARELTEKCMARSSTAGINENQAEFGDYRTSMSTLYDDMWKEHRDPLLVKLNRRIEKLLNLELVKNRSSIMQIALYGGVGGYTEFHLDTLQGSYDPFDEEGDRIATFLMFTKEVKMGGYTAFPKLGISARPIKGSAIFWFNLLQNGKPDIRAFHGGCPVILGSKEVINRWIHQLDNIWKYPCSIYPSL